MLTRLFVAAWPSDEAIEYVRGLVTHHSGAWPGVRWTPERNWHVTLRFLGEADAADVAARLAEVESWPAAKTTIGSHFEQLAGHSVVVPVDGVEPLAGAVAAACRHPLDRFVGHLTVGRLRRNHRYPTSTPGPVQRCSFEVTRIALVASTLTPEGPIYDTVASFVTTPGGGR